MKKWLLALCLLMVVLIPHVSYVKADAKIQRDVFIEIGSEDLAPEEQTMSERKMKQDFNNGLFVFLKRYKVLIAGVLGVCTLSVILFFSYFCTALAAAGGEPMKRKHAITQLFVCGLVLACFGCMDVVCFAIIHLLG